MPDKLFSARTAALPLFISGLLHVPIFLVLGFTWMSGAMAIVGIVYLAIAAGLRRGWRWLAWIAFLLMAFGAVSAYIASGGGTDLQRWWWSAIVMMDLIAAIILFVCLWRHRTKTAGSA